MKNYVSYAMTFLLFLILIVPSGFAVGGETFSDNMEDGNAAVNGWIVVYNQQSADNRTVSYEYSTEEAYSGNRSLKIFGNTGADVVLAQRTGLSMMNKTLEYYIYDDLSDMSQNISIGYVGLDDIHTLYETADCDGALCNVWTASSRSTDEKIEGNASLRTDAMVYSFTETFVPNNTIVAAWVYFPNVTTGAMGLQSRAEIQIPSLNYCPLDGNGVMIGVNLPGTGNFQTCSQGTFNDGVTPFTPGWHYLEIRRQFSNYQTYVNGVLQFSGTDVYMGEQIGIVNLGSGVMFADNIRVSRDDVATYTNFYLSSFFNANKDFYGVETDIYNVTGVPRSAGWRNVKMYFAPDLTQQVYIDNVSVDMSANPSYVDSNWTSVGFYSSDSGVMYIDDVSLYYGSPNVTPPPSNTPPVVETLSFSVVNNNATLLLFANVTDQNNGSVIIFTNRNISGVITPLSSVSIGTGVLTNYLNVSASVNGTYSFCAYADDGINSSAALCSASQSITFNVPPTPPPTPTPSGVDGQLRLVIALFGIMLVLGFAMVNVKDVDAKKYLFYAMGVMFTLIAVAALVMM